MEKLNVKKQRQQHPNEHTKEGKEMTLRRYPIYKDDMIMLWNSLRKSGYTRKYPNMLMVIKKSVKLGIEKRVARKLKPYEGAAYLEQKTTD